MELYSHNINFEMDTTFRYPANLNLFIYIKFQKINRKKPKEKKNKKMKKT